MMLQPYILPIIVYVYVYVWVRQMETYQHGINVQTPVDRWEVHQVLSCKNLSDTDEVTSLLSHSFHRFFQHASSSARKKIATKTNI